MPDDIVNPIDQGNTPAPMPKTSERDNYIVGDIVACYGGDQSLQRHWIGQQGQVRIINGDLLTVAFIPTVASDISTLTFHKKQVRKLKQAGGRTLWLNQTNVNKVNVGEDKPFDVLATYRPQDEPTWLRFEQKTVEYEEE